MLIVPSSGNHGPVSHNNSFVSPSAEAQKSWTKRTRERSQSTPDPLRLTLGLVSTPPTIARGQSVKPPACHSHPLPRHSTLTSHRHDAPSPSTSPYASTLHSPPICAALYSSAPSIPTFPLRPFPLGLPSRHPPADPAQSAFPNRLISFRRPCLWYTKTAPPVSSHHFRPVR
jgi:hypothetical protein